MADNGQARTGTVWATRNDPRITPVGRVIRCLWLEERPEFVKTPDRGG
jgi:lipopolysaccharide/colanic/teichoic acid biosynthesis glycosyltransferase